MVRGLPLLPHGRPARLVRVGRSQARRLAAEQLGEQFRRAGLDRRRLPTGQSYLHNHLAEQPDLNWWNEEVRAAFDGIMRFWCDRGVAGFRIDVCNVIIKDAWLRDNPAATEDDDFEAQMFGQRSVYNTNRPEVHEVIRRWRALADSYGEPRVLIGETPVAVDDLAAYYGNGSDELHLAFNFPFISAPFEAEALRAVVEADRGGPAAGRLAGVDGIEPRHVPLPHPLGRR